MNLYDIPIFGMLRAKMDWLNERQRILAENISNASTQGYKAKDLKAPTFSDLMQMAHQRSKDEERQLNAASSGMSGSTGSPRQMETFKAKTIEDGEMTPNGNSVVLEEQMMKVAETQTEFQSAIEIYRKGINLLHIATRS